MKVMHKLLDSYLYSFYPFFNFSISLLLLQNILRTLYLKLRFLLTYTHILLPPLIYGSHIVEFSVKAICAFCNLILVNIINKR